MLAREHWPPCNWIRFSSYINFLRHDYRCRYTSAHPYKRKTLLKGDTDVELGVVHDSTTLPRVRFRRKRCRTGERTVSHTCRVLGGVETHPSARGGCDPRVPCEIRLCHEDVDQGPTLLLTDAAILGTAGCGSNSDLLSLVRLFHPDRVVLFVCGNRILTPKP